MNFSDLALQTTNSNQDYMKYAAGGAMSIDMAKDYLWIDINNVDNDNDYTSDAFTTVMRLREVYLIATCWYGLKRIGELTRAYLNEKILMLGNTFFYIHRESKMLSLYGIVINNKAGYLCFV